MAKDTVNETALKKEVAGLKKANADLRDKNRELEETLDAIRSGEVDAIIVSKGDARQIYTLEGRDQPYRVLVENISEGALTLSHGGTVLYANSRFADMVKIPPGKIPGSSILEYVCPEYRAEMETALSMILNRSCRSRVRIRQGNGSLPVVISMNPLLHGDETKISVVVTDRRKDEDQIMLQARMLDAVGDAVIAADNDNKIIYWNDAATRTYGWTPEETIGHDLIEITTPDLSHEEARKIADRIKSGRHWTGEYVVNHRDGHEFPIHASDAPVFDDDGKLIAIIGASHDISDRRLMEQMLRESEARFRSVLDNSSDVIYRLNLQADRFEYISPASSVVVGFSPEEIQDMDRSAALAMIHPDDIPGFMASLSRLEETGQSAAEYRQQANNGGYRWLSNHMTLIRDGTGVPLFRDGIIRDITGRKQAEEQLRENEKQLKYALAEKEILLSEVHHRVKNNLTAFISLLSIDGPYAETEDSRSFKKDLQNRARSMALIHETLYQTGKFSSVDMKIYLSTLVHQIADTFAGNREILTEIEACGISLDLSRATTAGLIVNELVTNAFKYAFPPWFDCMTVRGEPCIIRVRLAEDNGAYILTVSDKGCGLPATIDPCKTKSMGLKLVTFLARYQLHAEIGITREKGTAFVFRMQQKEDF
jgi:PAS domain S-box-containing protein